MSDLEKLKSMFEDFGIGFEESDNEIKCSTDSEKVSGYTFFYTTFKFDDSGKFIEMGAWE